MISNHSGDSSCLIISSFAPLKTTPRRHSPRFPPAEPHPAPGLKHHGFAIEMTKVACLLSLLASLCRWLSSHSSSLSYTMGCTPVHMLQGKISCGSIHFVSKDGPCSCKWHQMTSLTRKGCGPGMAHGHSTPAANWEECELICFKSLVKSQNPVGCHQLYHLFMAWSACGVPSLAQTLPTKYLSLAGQRQLCRLTANQVSKLHCQTSTFTLTDRLNRKMVLFEDTASMLQQQREGSLQTGVDEPTFAQGTVWVLSKLAQPEEPDETAPHKWRIDGLSMAVWNGPAGDWFDLLRPRSLTPGRPARRSVTPRRHRSCIWKPWHLRVSHLIEGSCGMAWRDQITCFVVSVVLVSDSMVMPVRERHPWHQKAYIHR